MNVAIEVPFHFGKHGTIWTVAQRLLSAMARLEGDHEIYVHNHCFFDHGGKTRSLPVPPDPRFHAFVPPLPRRVVRALEDRGWPVRARVLRARGIELLNVFEQIEPAPPAFPTIVTFHDSIPFAHPEWFPAGLPELLRRNAREAVHLITLSERTKADIVASAEVPADKISVIALGVDTGFFKPADEAAKAELRRRYGLARPFVMGIGPFAAKKNFETALEAHAALRARGVDVELALVGGASPYRESLERIVQDRAIPGVRFVGAVPEADLPALYSSAAMLVYPSLHEGFPAPPLEAMACGCPLLVSRDAAIPEVVEGPALIFDTRDAGALAACVERVLKEPGLSARMREEGLERAARFTWAETARKTLAAYEEVLRG